MKPFNRKKTILFIFILVILSYYLYTQGSNVINGPSIEINSPLNGESYTKELIDIKGKATNISFLKLNNHNIFTDKNGFFDEKLLLFNGYNIIILEGESRFGKKTRKKIEVICHCQKN